jgi:hypothetical protein
LEENKSIKKVVDDLKKLYKIKEINISQKNDKRTELTKAQDMHITLKRFKKLLNEKYSIKENELFKPKQTFDNLEINLYKLKNELKMGKNNELILNISYPYKDEIIENLLANKIKI